MLPVRLEFSSHAELRMGQKMIDENQVRRIIEHGVRAPEVADAGAAPRFSYRGMIDGRWVMVVVAEESDRIFVLTIVAN